MLRGTKGFVLGVGTAYLFDPTLGAARRRRLLDRASGLGRGATERLGLSSRREPASDDASVLQRIRSDVLQDAGVSTDEIEVTVESGVATLTGSVATSGLADDLVRRVREVPGVTDVAAMVHVGRDEPGAEETTDATSA